MRREPYGRGHAAHPHPAGSARSLAPDGGTGRTAVEPDLQPGDGHRGVRQHDGTLHGGLPRLPAEPRPQRRTLYAVAQSAHAHGHHRDRRTARLDGGTALGARRRAAPAAEEGRGAGERRRQEARRQGERQRQRLSPHPFGRLIGRVRRPDCGRALCSGRLAMTTQRPAALTPPEVFSGQLQQFQEELQRAMLQSMRTLEVLSARDEANVGKTPKDVVWRRGTAQLYRYRSTTETVYPVPLLMVHSLVS